MLASQSTAQRAYARNQNALKKLAITKTSKHVNSDEDLFYDKESNYYLCERDETETFATKQEKLRFDRTTRKAQLAIVIMIVFLLIVAVSRPVYGPYIDRFGEDGDKKLIEVVKGHLKGREKKRMQRSLENDGQSFHARLRAIEEARARLLDAGYLDGSDEDLDEESRMRRLSDLEKKATKLREEHRRHSNHEGKRRGRNNNDNNNNKD